MRRAIALGAAGCMVAASGAATAAAAKHKPKPPKPKLVDVFDNYYGPAKVTIVPGQKVTWVWPSDIGDSHDVKTTKAIPKGAKKFQSPPYAVGAKWSQTFTKPGTYGLVCTFHPTEMTMTVVVKKK